MLKKLLIVIQFVIFYSAGFSQTITSTFGGSDVSDMLLTTSLSKNQLELRYEQIKGSPYYEEKFVSSDIYFLDGRIVQGIFTRLNLYDINLEFQRNSKFYVLTNIDNIAKVRSKADEFLYFPIDNGNTKKGFYKVVVLGEYQLLYNLEVKFKEERIATNSYSDDLPAEFVKAKKKYYIGHNNEILASVSNKKELQNIFSVTHPELKGFIKENKLNPGKSDDLKVIVEYLNTESSKKNN